jgi:hypothetical protein
MLDERSQQDRVILVPKGPPWAQICSSKRSSDTLRNSSKKNRISIGIEDPIYALV